MTSVDSYLQPFQQPCCVVCRLLHIWLWRFPCRSCVGLCLTVCVAYEMLGMPRGCSAVVSHLCCPLCCCWFAVPLAALCMLLILTVKIPHASHFQILIFNPTSLSACCHHISLQPLIMKHSGVLCRHINLHASLTPSAWLQKAFCHTWLPSPLADAVV